MGIGVNNTLGTSWCEEIENYVNWFAGAGAPPEELGAAHDVYLDTTEGRWYQKTETADGSPSWGEPIWEFVKRLTAENVSYANPAYPTIQNVKDALDEVLYFPPVASLTITVAGGTTHEIGETVDQVRLDWSFNKTVEDVTLTDVGPVPQAGSHTFSGLALRTAKTWTLSGRDSKNTATAQRGVSFQHRRYWGTSPAAALDSTGILALAGREFATGRTQTRTMSGAGEYLYFAYPKAWGRASFKVNGLDNSAFTEMEVDFTNASGHTERFYAYRTNTVQFGSGLSLQVL